MCADKSSVKKYLKESGDETVYTVDMVQLIEKINLENCTPDIDIKRIKISQPDVNRPALQLAGFYDYFDAERVQIGYIEHAYMQKFSEDKRLEIMSRLMDYKVPCIVFAKSWGQ